VHRVPPEEPHPKENLDLTNTFVPLSFRSKETGRETLRIATTVLADPNAGNLIIQGAPGSGKSTLLKSYGVGLVHDNRRLPRRKQILPFFIPMRKLVRYGSSKTVIADYLIHEILNSGVGMSHDRARRLLKYTLKKGRVLVMLDGLDEVTADHYRTVLEAVYEFANDRRPGCPSHQARIMITCRTQNFLSLRDEWIPVIAATECFLAPLRNSEIFSYLNKLRLKFARTGGPESFFQAVKTSGTLDLHRTPLILAMSVGLYAMKDYFEIPSSIAKLYQEMIMEMLDRHRFKGDPIGAALSYQLNDKYRFLSEFALHVALEGQGFAEFTKTSIVRFGQALAPDLNDVRNPEAFVEEIIQRSGLLTYVGEPGRYVFAHRSIQEFLVADELQEANRPNFLLTRADDLEWRQVVQFYSAGLKQRQADAFLPMLARENPELAGYCLAVAKVSDHVAATVLSTLQPVNRVELAALAAATMSPRLSVQKIAINRLKQVLSGPGSPLSAISGEVDALLPLLNSLAGSNAAEIAEFVPQIIEHIPDDPRLVEPLWRCLTIQGIERLPACYAIVGRLLILATSRDGFEELVLQESHIREFLTEDIRRRAYPFEDGFDRQSNLVTLLTWADYLQIIPVRLNRYFEAKKAGALDKVEAARRKAILFYPYRPVRILDSALILTSIAVAAIVISTDHNRLLHPYKAWTAILAIGTAVAPCIMTFAIGGFADFFPDSRLQYLLGTWGTTEDSPHVVDKLKPKWLAVAIGVIITPIAISASWLPLLTFSLVGYIISTMACGLLYWAPEFDGLSRGHQYYLYRPSPYIDMYDDPRSRHWIVHAPHPYMPQDAARPDSQPVLRS